MSEFGPFSEGVTLALEAPATAFAPGAPIVLTARLMNYGGGPIHVTTRSQWADYDVHVVRDGEGELLPSPVVAQRREAALEGRRIAREVPNKEKLSEEIALGEWFDLSRPGRYRVVASRGFTKPEPPPPRAFTVRSNELVLDVRAEP